jgi:hypothetical protein
VLNILTAQDKVTSSVIKLELQRCRAENGEVTACLKLPTLFEANKQTCSLHDTRYLITESIGPYLPYVEWHDMNT